MRVCKGCRGIGWKVPHLGDAMQIPKFSERLLAVLLFGFLLLSSSRLIAGVTASISGTVTDSTGAVLVGAAVSATNVATSVVSTQTTNGQGFYSLQALPLGTYTLDVSQKGFKAYRQTGLTVDVNTALVVDVVMEVGAASQTVTVSSGALHVDTESTQMGEVI